MTKIKDKRENIKSSKGKAINNIQGNSMRLSADFSTATADQKGVPQYI